MIRLPAKADADLRPYLCSGTVLMEVADYGDYRAVFSVILTTTGPVLPGYCIVREVFGKWSIVNRLDGAMISALAVLPDPATVTEWDSAGVEPVTDFGAEVRNRASTLLEAAAAMRARIGGLVE